MRFLSRTISRSSAKGFTLIEVLIIAPVVILAISGFVALMVTMTADVLVTRDQNNMTYENQDALDRIEQDVRLSTQFLVTSGTFTAPQGSNNNFTGTSAFTNTSSTLILGGVTTDKNPVDTSRKLVYYAGQPNLCGPQEAYNRPFLAKIIYFIKDGSLWRRSVLPDYNTNAALDDNTVCSTPWQRNTCSPGYSSSTRCQTNDTEMMKNVASFTTTYFGSPGSTTPLTNSQALSATTIEVALSGKKTTVGRDVTSSGTLRATKLNNIDVDIPAPGTPDVSAQVDGNTVTFSWPKVPLASSYLISYNINGGTPTTATLNSQTTTYVVNNAARTDTVTISVTARNSTGTSAPGTASATIPGWYACPMPLNGWDNYQNGYADASYTKTSADVVVLKGLIRNGTTTANTPICVLPVGYRPDKRLVFATSSNSAHGRLDVAPNGEVRFVTGSNAWFSLDGIRFVANTAGYTWTSPALQNGSTDYGSDLSPHETTVDNQGRVHVRGAIKNGTYTAGTTIFTLPAAQSRWNQFTYLPESGGNGFNWVGVGGVIDARLAPTAGTHLSLQAMFYPSTYTNWTNLALQNSWAFIGNTNHATPQYTKSADGIVTLKGMIKRPTNDDGTVIAQLPPGYRPKEQLLTSCVSFGAFCRIDVKANGEIFDTLSPNSSGWVSLDNISFIAEQ